jgi:hypothetical protein
MRMNAPYRHLYGRGQRAGGAVFLTLFGGLFLYFMLPEIVASLTAANWTPATCTILSSAVGRQRSTDREALDTLYRLEVRYAYQASGTRHESTRYRFIDPYTDNSAAVQGAVARYHVGAAVSCYVDPADASQAVLDRRLSPFMLVALLPGAIFGLGLWSLISIGLETVRGRF